MSRRILFLAMILAAVSVAAQAQSGGDKVHFGENIILRQGETANNVVCFFCAVQVQGHVDQNVVVFFGEAAVSGDVGQNAVVFLGDLHLFSHATIGQNAVIFGGRLHTTPDSVVGQNRVVFPPIVVLLPILIMCGFVAALISLIRMIMLRRQQHYPVRQP